MPKLLLTLVACLLPVASAYSGPLSSQGEAVELVLESVNCSSGPYKPRLPKTMEGFRALGGFLREQVQPAGDYSGDPKTHTSANFWFEGMSVDVVFLTQKPYGYFLEGATFSHPRWNRLTPIKVGSSITDFLKKEKLPPVSPQSKRVRICGAAEGAPDCIELLITKDRITQVEYGCYTG